MLRSLPCIAGLLAFSELARAEPELSARLVCQPVPAPGRVLCEIELGVEAGRLVWADALVVSSPNFAKPLRARVGAARPQATSAGGRKISLAFMAVQVGRAPLEVLARAVVCSSARAGEEECRPLRKRLASELAVGEGL